MQSVTFLGEVQAGRILTGQTLADFEGKPVYVTLIVPEGPVTQSEPVSEEAELLEDPGRVRIPRRAVSAIEVDVVDVGRRLPREYAEEE